MNKREAIIFLAGILMFSAACSSAPNVANSPAGNTNISVQRAGNTTTVSSHSNEKSAVQTNSTSSSSSAAGNSSMARPIDVSEMTAAVEKAEKDYKARQSDAKTKDALAESYFVRAFALTEAAQYRAALGDFRKGLKLKPDAKEAKEMHDRIIDIFKSINREPPKEGEEPPPLPFDKKA